MKSTLTKDILIGVVAGLIAVGVLALRRPVAQIPAGLYQAPVNLARYREMEEMLRPATSSAPTQALLGKRIEKLNVTGVALDSLIQYIGDLAGVEILVEWGQFEEAVMRNEPITADLTGMTLGEGLKKALQLAGQERIRLAFQIEGDRVRISTYERLSKDLYTRVYDVREILKAMVAVDKELAGTRPVTTRPAFGGNGPGFVPELTADNLNTASDILIRFIQERIDVVSWRDAGGSDGSIRYLAGKLIVTQTRGNHDDLAMLLYWLKENLGKK